MVATKNCWQQSPAILVVVLPLLFWTTTIILTVAQAHEHFDSHASGSNIAENNPFLSEDKSNQLSRIQIPVNNYLSVAPDPSLLEPRRGCQESNEIAKDFNFMNQNFELPFSTTRNLNSRRRLSVTGHFLLEQSQQEQNEHDQRAFPRMINNSNAIKPSLRKTGTTIAGVVGRDYCILAADTRATMDMTVADNRAEKLHPLTHQVWAAGAGTSADLQHFCRACKFSHQLMALQLLQSTGNSPKRLFTTTSASTSTPSAAALCHWLREQLYRQQGSCQAHLIVGGICAKTRKPFLRALHPHGSMDVVGFAALGSGGYAAMAVLEASAAGRGDDNISEDDAVLLLQRAILAGIQNDLGSGSQVDVVILRANGTTDYRRAAVPEPQLPDIAQDWSLQEETRGGFFNRNGGRGVNGFGNTPFMLRKVFGRPSQILPKTREQVESEWNDVLGLP